MKIRAYPAMRRLSTLLSLFAVCLMRTLPAVQAQQWSAPGAVDIMIGRPSIWTLAQAHYLLAQMHKDDRAWKVAALNDLDPNAINEQRMEVLKTLLGVTADFDATAGVKNRLLEQRYETNYSRQQTVRTEIDRRSNDLIQANRDLYNINVDITRLKAAQPPDQDAIKAKTAELDAKTTERDAINTRISALNTELSGLQSENITNNVPSLAAPFGGGSQPSPSPLVPSLSGLIDKSFLDKVYSDTANKSSQLQASTRLDNYIQMQYELISKQLTLLRDEVGENERVIFLELPSGIYSVPKKGDDYIAQVRWKVTRYCPIPTSTPTTSAEVSYRTDNFLRTAPTQTPEPPPDAHERNTQVLAKQLGLTAEPTPTPAAALTNCFGPATVDDVRTVDIIPRQSALNVNAVHDTSKGFALTARFLTVFGFGGKVDYQRQREVYDQFVYQDIFASGFGKGSNVFGWTFGPLPGTKALAPGVRTTYAVLVIPASARKIEIVGQGYVFRRGELEPSEDATPAATQTFKIDIPGDDTNGFFVSSADYASVQSGKRVSLVLGGPYFSPQVGVLVNGEALQRKVALAPIDSPSPAPAVTPAPAVSGEYEYVNARRLIATFSMSDSYEGTPVIALVTPEKTSIINRYKIRVNNKNWAEDSLELHGLLEPMFLAPLAINRVQFIDRWIDAVTGKSYVQAVVSGKGFRPEGSISVNGTRIRNGGPVTLRDGTPVYPVEQKSTHEYDIVFPDPGTPSWDITIRQNTTQGQEEISYPLVRPLAPHVTYDILRYMPNPQSHVARMDLRINGSEFQRITDVSLFKDGTVSAPWICRSRGPAPPVDDAPLPGGRRRRTATPKPLPLIGSCTTVSAGEVLVTISLTTADRNESLLLLVAGDKGESAVLNILPPAAPTISSIVNDATKKAEGSLDGNYTVVIRGANLDQVERVFFGAKPAQIQQSAPGVLTVVVPKGDEGPVRVLLETNTPYLGKFLSNTEDFSDPKETRAIFTYLKPKPPS